jgi:hypothetical protein
MTVNRFVFASLIAVSSIIGLTGTIHQSIAQTIRNTPNQKPLQNREVTKLKKVMKEEIETVLGLAGLDKIVKPPEFDQQLQNYRAKLAKVNPEVTPFLGNWIQNWEMSEPALAIAIFPSRIKGQICVIEYQDNQNYLIPPEEKRPPNPLPKFSTLKIRNRQGQTSNLRLHRSLISKNGSGYAGEVEFMGVAIAKTKLRLYASQGIPKLDSDLPKQILQKFQANQCQQG